MPKPGLTRRTITWSKETDTALQRFLGKPHDLANLSNFVEDAVRWRIFDRTVQTVKARNQSFDPEDLQAVIDKAVKETRCEMARERSQDAAN